MVKIASKKDKIQHSNALRESIDFGIDKELCLLLHFEEFRQIDGIHAENPIFDWYRAGWEPINTNIPESISVGSQYWGLSIGICGVLNISIDQV